MVKEYIEREKVLKDGRWNSMILFNDTERAREIILCQPAADVVEVVKCKDCKHYNTYCCSEGFGWCEELNRAVSDEKYCSCGEKRDNNAND